MGFFDIQVNGYGGVDFNQDHVPLADARRACERLRRDGVDGILATIITEKVDVMAARLRRLVELREADPLIRSMFAGIHIEGPFLSSLPGFRGAHPVDAICDATPEITERLLQAAGGLTRIFTLAPERDPSGRVTRMLADRGIVVSAGHTDASIEELSAAIRAGLRMFTHLGNGCPMSIGRHDNIVQRVLYLRRQLWICFIADGVHVAYPALRNYLDLAGPAGKCIVTTDAMAAAGLGKGTYKISRWDVAIGDDLVARSPDGSHLLGSVMPFPKVAENLAHLGYGSAAIAEWMEQAPRAAIGL